MPLLLMSHNNRFKTVLIVISFRYKNFHPCGWLFGYLVWSISWKKKFGSSTKYCKSCLFFFCLIKGNYVGGRKASLAGNRLKRLTNITFLNLQPWLNAGLEIFSFNSLSQPGSFFLFSGLRSILPFQHPVPFTSPFYFLEKKNKWKGKKAAMQ